MFAETIFGVILIVITLYIVYAIVYSGSNTVDLVPSIQSLAEKKDILYPDQTQSLLLGGAGSTVMGFFKLENGDKTVKFANSFTPLLQVENNWFLEVAPAPVGRDHTTARLRVQTNDAGVFKQEIIDLPNIPKQKWVFLAILRDGRRFDVLYDNQIVASQRLESYPVIISSSLSVGNKGLSGYVSHVLVNGTRLTPDQVERERLIYVNTNNTVVDADPVASSFPSTTLFARCPSGLPCDPITKPPSNNLLQWRSPYA
jgi:hypothetical protein